MRTPPVHTADVGAETLFLVFDFDDLAALLAIMLGVFAVKI